MSFIGYYRCGCLRRRGFTWSSGDAGICHAPALNERRRRRRRRRRREPAHRRTAPADSGEAAAAIPSDTTGASHRGANSPPRRCLRSHVFDGLLASKRGTARLGTRTIQQHCINVPSKWTLSLFGWAQRPSHTPTRPSIFASKNPCPLDCPRLCLLASSLLLLLGAAEKIKLNFYYLQLGKNEPNTLARKGGAMMTSDPRLFYRKIEYRSQDEFL